MGQEAHQSHRFACRSCGEEIGIGLEVDYDSISHRTVVESNCTFAEEKSGAEIVNLDANFVIPADQQGQDLAFPRLQQMQLMTERLKADGVKVSKLHVGDSRIEQRPFRRPDFGQEWSELRKAWTLHRRDQKILSRGIVRNASEALYSGDPLSGLPDWLWRFCLHLTARNFHPRLHVLLRKLNAILQSPNSPDLIEHYRCNMVSQRGRRYISIMTEYFRAYSEFAQVQFLLSSGIRPATDEHVSSTNFEVTKMFYGNAFEVLADSMDLIAILNNVNQGRRYDVFSKLTLSEYYKLDKSGRANCFASDAEFSLVSIEFDNQIRNASHHGGMDFDQLTQMISYRSGKGGTGPEMKMTYTDYLVRCVEIFMQIICILQIDLILAQSKNIEAPL
jgi:hypothetical protein